MADSPIPRTIAQAAAALRSGAASPAAVLDACLARIRNLDGRIRAWVMVDESAARKQAERAGAEIAAGNVRGPLHGIPVGVKDIFDIEGLPTLAASKTRTGHVAKSDAFVVGKLREAGAVIVGKTVTTEFASFDPPPTRNPWNLHCTPGGSSSGSAAAVAAGMCFAALASQTGGSITRPAAYCGVVGFKPTYGRVSLRGVVPLAYSMDHVGCIARSADDAAAVLSVIGEADPECPVQCEPPECGRPAGAVFGARGPRLARLADFDPPCHQMVRSLVDAAAAKLAAAGAALTSSALPMSLDEVYRMHRRHMCGDALAYHRATFAARRADYGPCIASLLDEGLTLSAADYGEARKRQTDFRHGLRRSFGDADVLLTPAATMAAPAAATTGDPLFNSPWSWCGFPTVCVPCGLTPDGMPAGIQLVGRPFDEARLLAAAAWCERVLGFTASPAC